MSFSFAFLSGHGFVNSVGAYVGLGSLVAVALLVLLYFAHARETATLRDRLDEAQQRISGLEGRIGQLMQMQAAQRGRAPGPVAPAPPVPVRAAGAPQGSVRRIPNPATAAAAATAAPATGLAAAASPPRPAGLTPAAPAGMGGPALASATKLIPDPVTTGEPDDTMFVPAAAAAAANGKAGAEHTAVLAAAKQTPAAAASARAASASPRGPVAPPPRMQIGGEPDGAEAAATAAGGAGRIRRIGGNPQTTTVLPVFDDESVGGGGRFSGALLPILIAGLAVVVIVVGLIVISNSGGSTSGNVNHSNTNAGTTGQTLHNKKPAPTPFSAADFKVAVLNGTAQSGLAGDVGSKLARAGYKKGNITNAASQTEGLTFVYYVSGKANKLAAQHVAKALTLPPSRVRKAGKSVLQSCAISATGTSLGSCSAQLIVSVGQDRVSLATG